MAWLFGTMAVIGVLVVLMNIVLGLRRAQKDAQLGPDEFRAKYPPFTEAQNRRIVSDTEMLAREAKVLVFGGLAVMLLLPVVGLIAYLLGARRG